MLSFFYRGIHLPDHKKTTCHGASMPMEPAPRRVYLPVTAERVSDLAVKSGDHVDLGQLLLDQSEGFAAIHAPVSGTLLLPELHPLADGTQALCLVVENDNRQSELVAEEEQLPIRDVPELLRPEEIWAAARRYGVAGMGGDGLPTDQKLEAAFRRVNLLILNGAECDPYATADQRLMLERPAAVLGGARLLLRALDLKTGIVAVGGNQYEAVAALRALLPLRGGDLQVRAIRARYPLGEEGALVRTLTGRPLPRGGRPQDVGAIVLNVATAAALYDGVYGGRALTQRLVTVTGSAIAKPCNLLVPIGSPVADLIAAAGGFSASPDRVLVGGALMGRAQTDLSVPILKGSSVIIAMTAEEAKPAGSREGPCLRCGRCARACPEGLQPAVLRQSVEAEHWAALEPLHMSACTECGACAYVCPARRRLTEYLRRGKSHLGEEGEGL
ncbi:MAG: electron transport complex subunit RsxC [Pseudoflavonifractor sp.]